MDKRIEQIRENEKKSHTEIYSRDELYTSGGWLHKPIKTIKEITPLFKEYKKLNVLDLGCGVGRNSIFIAQEYQNIDCIVECVDILEIAIEKLYSNANIYHVSSHIHGVVKSIEEYDIPRENGISALKSSVVSFVARKKN